ncbi:MAG: hypothetical protein V1792_22185 [Pseudomonadota bacterium]
MISLSFGKGNALLPPVDGGTEGGAGGNQHQRPRSHAGRVLDEITGTGGLMRMQRWTALVVV